MLRFVIEKIEDVATSLREHYTKGDDGKFRLSLDGEHPDTARVAEFRANNIKLTKDLARFEGIDPDKAKAESAELTELKKAKPDEKIAALEAKLAEAQGRADASVLKSAITDAFIRAGGRAEATEFMTTKATSLFAVENGVLVGRTFDPNRPGEKLSVDGFIAAQVRESAFAFKPSSGGGADPKPAGGQPGGKRLVNPTPQELGANAAAIARGDIKVDYTT
jgi:hypothetical protein